MTQQRWEVWLWTCVFALLPLLLWLILVRVVGVEPATGVAEVARELLFFALAICTLVLSDLRDVDAVRRSHRWYESLRACSAALAGFVVGTLTQVFIHHGSTNARAH